MLILKGRDIAKAFSLEQLKELGLNPESDFEIIKIRGGVFALAEKEPLPEKEKKIEAKKPGNDALGMESKILAMLGEKRLSDRVEGRFEKLLSQKEADYFKEMLKEGKVFAFKLSDKYKKPVYKIAALKKKDSETTALQNKPISEYCLEKDGLLVCTDRKKAEILSYELKDAIKDGRISGIKSFDGNYYIIETELLMKYRPVFLGIINANKTISFEELAEKAAVNTVLARIVCEFLKEDGEIIEKKKGQYTYVK
ncbi:MAG: hypothetical protein PHH08_03460 [Candidatus ainarchaeum sp.]|nr:hypothetical protein [Candidatus ainarchaeum sp.]